MAWFVNVPLRRVLKALEKVVVDQAEDASTGMMFMGPEGSGVMWQTECRGLACGAVGFGDDCEVVGGVQLAEFPCFPFLLVRVVADEPFSIPSSASIVIVIWVVDGCVCVSVGLSPAAVCV